MPEQLFAYKISAPTYPQIWTTTRLDSIEIYNCHRRGKRPYSVMPTSYREVFPYHHPRAMASLEPVNLQGSGLCLTTDFSLTEGWIVPTWEVEMSVIQALVLQAFKDKLIDESFTRSRYNKLTKILTLSLEAGTQGERQGALLAATRVTNAFKERIQHSCQV